MSQGQIYNDHSANDLCVQRPHYHLRLNIFQENPAMFALSFYAPVPYLERSVVSSVTDMFNLLLRASLLLSITSSATDDVWTNINFRSLYSEKNYFVCLQLLLCEIGGDEDFFMGEMPQIWRIFLVSFY